MYSVQLGIVNTGEFIYLFIWNFASFHITENEKYKHCIGNK